MPAGTAKRKKAPQGVAGHGQLQNPKKATKLNGSNDAPSTGRLVEDLGASGFESSAPTMVPQVAPGRELRSNRGIGGHAAQLEKAIRPNLPRLSAQKRAEATMPEDLAENELAPPPPAKRGRKPKKKQAPPESSGQVEAPAPMAMTPALSAPSSAHGATGGMNMINNSMPVHAHSSQQALYQSGPQFYEAPEGSRFGFQPFSTPSQPQAFQNPTSNYQPMLGGIQATLVHHDHRENVVPTSGPGVHAAHHASYSFMGGLDLQDYPAFIAQPLDMAPVAAGRNLQSGSLQIAPQDMPIVRGYSMSRSNQPCQQEDSAPDNIESGSEAGDTDESEAIENGDNDDNDSDDVEEEIESQDQANLPASRSDFADDHWASPSDDEQMELQLQNQTTSNQGNGSAGAVDQANINQASESEYQDVLQEHRIRNRAVKPPSLTTLARAGSFQVQSSRAPTPFVPSRSSTIADLGERNTGASASPAVHSTSDQVIPAGGGRPAPKPTTLTYYVDDPGWTHVLKQAKNKFKRNTALFNAFPDRDGDLQQATVILSTCIQDYLAGGNVLSQKYSPTRDMSIVVFDEHSNFRSAMKKIGREVVRRHYRTIVEINDPNIQNQLGITNAVQSNVEEILQQARYLRGDPDENGVPSNIAHPAIWALISEFYFKDEESVGAICREDFERKIPNHAVALVLTCIANCLDEFSGGRHSNKDFSGDNYRSTFNALANMIEDVENDPVHGPLFQKRKADWARWGSTKLKSLSTQPARFTPVIAR